MEKFLKTHLFLGIWVISGYFVYSMCSISLCISRNTPEDTGRDREAPRNWAKQNKGPWTLGILRFVWRTEHTLGSVGPRTRSNPLSLTHTEYSTLTPPNPTHRAWELVQSYAQQLES